MDDTPPSPAHTWCVYRQDDTGNTFLIEANLSKEEAYLLAAELEQRGHKQVYWVQQKQ